MLAPTQTLLIIHFEHSRMTTLKYGRAYLHADDRYDRYADKPNFPGPMRPLHLPAAPNPQHARVRFKIALPAELNATRPRGPGSEDALAEHIASLNDPSVWSRAAFECDCGCALHPRGCFAALYANALVTGGVTQLSQFRAVGKGDNTAIRAELAGCLKPPPGAPPGAPRVFNYSVLGTLSPAMGMGTGAGTGAWVATGGGHCGDENARVRVLWRVAGTFLGRVPRARGTNGDTGRAGRGYARAKGFAGGWVATGGGCHGHGAPTGTRGARVAGMHGRRVSRVAG